MAEHKVIVYGTTACPWCVRAKEWLRENKIKFAAYDVGDDPDKAQEMLKKSGQMGVPVIDVDGKIVVGFNEPKLRELLGI